MPASSSQVIFYTEDHKPFNPREKERIQNAGGSVTLQRVNGSLAVSRALGDFDFKEVGTTGSLWATATFVGVTASQNQETGSGRY